MIVDGPRSIAVPPMRRGSVWQMIRFCLVGMLATATHFATALFVLDELHFRPSLANASGFALALVVSFLGHSFFTFRAAVSPGSVARFVVVSLTTVVLGSVWVEWLTRHTILPSVYVIAIGAVASAGFNFVGHSAWSFRHRTT